MKYIITTTTVYEPDNNTPQYCVFVKVVDTATEKEAYDIACQDEHDLCRNDEEIVDTEIKVEPFKENELTMISEIWGA